MKHTEATKKKISETLKRKGIKPTVLPNREQCLKNLGVYLGKGDPTKLLAYIKEHGAWNKGLKGYRCGEKNNKWKGGKPKCLDCGVQLTSYKAKRCGNCHKKWMVGDKVYNWKGGVPRRYETGDAYACKKWAKAVYQRDHYSCMFCGKKCGRDIQAHHIIAWVDDRDKRFEINNGLTLCFKCHLKTRGKESFYSPLCNQLLGLKDNPMYVKNILRFELP